MSEQLRSRAATQPVGEANEIFVAHSASCGCGAIIVTLKPRRGDIGFSPWQGIMSLASRARVQFANVNPQLALWAINIPPANAGLSLTLTPLPGKETNGKWY